MRYIGRENNTAGYQAYYVDERILDFLIISIPIPPFLHPPPAPPSSCIIIIIIMHHHHASPPQEVIDLLELNPIRKDVVGRKGEGLSTEQRKRLTIGVELVANPSLIFLDEPTSGR